jgi:predicted nucleotidyltransferase
LDPQRAIEILREHREGLQGRGVRHAALFGSLARGEADAKSDIDVLIELDPAAEIDLFGYVGLKQYIAGLFDGQVDVVDKEALKPSLRQPVAAEAVYAF